MPNYNKCIFCEFEGLKTCNEKCLTRQALGPATKRHEKIYKPVWDRYGYNIYYCVDSRDNLRKISNVEELHTNLMYLVYRVETIPDAELWNPVKAQEAAVDLFPDAAPLIFDLEM